MVPNTFPAGDRVGAELACDDRSRVIEMTHRAD
jgi:hypothetical protein